MATYSESADDLRMAGAINDIAFRMSGGDRSFDKPTTQLRICCELQGSAVQNMDDYSKRLMAQELNEAIAPVLQKWSEKYLVKVRRAVGATA